MALPQTDPKEREERLPPTAYRDMPGAAEAEPETVTAHERQRFETHRLAPWVLWGFVASVAFQSWRRLAHSRNDILNRRAAKLYQKLAEQEFGAVKVERADLPGEMVTRLIVPLRGEEIEREVDEALMRVLAIHDKVERMAPELVGRIVFDYASDGRPR